MSQEEFMQGEEVEWNTLQGKTCGTAKKKLTSHPEVSGQTIAASKDDPHQRRDRLANYWGCYYNELREQLINHISTPESVPPHLRGHDQRIRMWECTDGYVILHYADPENTFSATTPVRFEPVVDTQNETVVQVMNQESLEEIMPSDTPFWVTHAPLTEDETTGEYEVNDLWERLDLIANRRIEQWDAERWRAQSAEEAIAQAQEDLQGFFEGQSSA